MGLLNCAREQRLVDNNALAAMVKSVKSTSSPFEKIQRYLAFGLSLTPGYHWLPQGTCWNDPDQ